MPLRMGVRRPAVSPKEWNIGNGLKKMSASLRARRRKGLDLAGVGDEIGARQDDPLRRALGARGEKDEAGSSGFMPVSGVQRTGAPRVEQTPQLVEARDRRAHVFEVDDVAAFAESAADVVVELGLVDEAPRGDEGSDACNLAGGAQVCCAGGEVEHGRHRPCGKAEEGDDEPWTLGIITPTCSPGRVTLASFLPRMREPSTSRP